MHQDLLQLQLASISTIFLNLNVLVAVHYYVAEPTVTAVKSELVRLQPFFALSSI